MTDALRDLVRRWHPVVDAAWRFEAGELDAEAVKVAVRQQLRGGACRPVAGGVPTLTGPRSNPATALDKGEA